MNDDIQPAIIPLNLEHVVKPLKAYEACRGDTNRPGPDSYLPGWRGGLVMRRRARVFLTGFLVTLTLAGCASTPPERVLSTKEPAYAAILEQMYTQVTDKDIFESRSIFDMLSSDSLRDTAPLRALIAKYITAETLQRVAAAFDDNRLLMIGTTNVDYGQTWIWNMSLLAKHGKLDLYRDVLLASASFPIVFPPVEIDGHLFVDGAARSNVVVVGIGGSERPGPPLHGPGNVYLISNGKFQHPPAALRRALGNVAATTVGVMMDQSMQTALTRTYFGAQPSTRGVRSRNSPTHG